jgi:hypothetical protein
MNKVFDPFLGLFLQIFINDFGVYSDRTFHLTKLELIFECLDSSGVTLSPEKTTIGFSKGKMVGHIVSKDGVAIDPEKLHRISKLPFPTTKKALGGFLGMEGYYSRFIHMFVTKTCPLTRFLREDARIPMEDEVSKWALEQLKSAFQVAPNLRTLDWNKPFLLYCDAFGEVMGNTLSQLDKNGHDHPIHFAKR